MITKKTGKMSMKQNVEKYLEKALQEPYHVVSFVEEGFGFLLHWAEREKYFMATMLFNPKWGHSNHVWGYTKEDFIEDMENQIAEAKKIFVNGGRYPADYYNH